MSVSQSVLPQRTLAIYTDHGRLQGVAWLDMYRNSFNKFPVHWNYIFGRFTTRSPFQTCVSLMDSIGAHVFGGCPLHLTPLSRSAI